MYDFEAACTNVSSHNADGTLAARAHDVKPMSCSVVQYPGAAECSMKADSPELPALAREMCLINLVANCPSSSYTFSMPCRGALVKLCAAVAVNECAAHWALAVLLQDLLSTGSAAEAVATGDEDRVLDLVHAHNAVCIIFLILCWLVCCLIRCRLNKLGRLILVRLQLAKRCTLCTSLV